MRTMSVSLRNRRRGQSLVAGTWQNVSAELLNFFIIFYFFVATNVANEDDIERETGLSQL